GHVGPRLSCSHFAKCETNLRHTFRSVAVPRQTFGRPAHAPVRWPCPTGHLGPRLSCSHFAKDQSPSTGSGCTSLRRLLSKLGQVGARRLPPSAGKKRTTQLLCRTTESRWLGSSWAVNPTGTPCNTRPRSLSNWEW